MGDGEVGHETSREGEAIGRLEAALEAAFPLESALDLAQLYYEPAHRGLEALALARVAYGMQSSSSRARLLLAYGNVWVVMTESALREAVELLRPMTEDQGEVGAGALALLVSALSDLGEIMPEDSIAYLERSVQAAPTWVSNRRVLARLYSDAGRKDDAREQLRASLHNVLDPATDLDPIEDSFHSLFTGRREPATTIQGELDSLPS